MTEAAFAGAGRTERMGGTPHGPPALLNREGRIAPLFVNHGPAIVETQATDMAGVP